MESINCTKKLTAKKREALEPLIKERALAWCVAEASVEEIDEINILQATMLAMQRAVAGLKVQPEFVQVDGNRIPKLPMMAEAIVKGDAKVAAISAASILAKTHRDAYMMEQAHRYPGYGFEKHMGYGTAEHIKAIETLGVLPIHRKTFKPISLYCQEEK